MSASTLPPQDRSTPSTLAAASEGTGIIITRRGLRSVGIDSFLYVPRLTVSSGHQAGYRGSADTAADAVHVVSTGITGELEVVQREGRSWTRSRSRWNQVRGFRWSPAGPTPTYGVAAVIAEMAVRRGTLSHFGEEVVAGLPASHSRADLEDGLRIDLSVTRDGVVGRVAATEPSARGVTTTQFEIHSLNGPVVIPQTDG